MADVPQLVAHRGYTLHYPENTLVGIGAAIKAGARYVEVDVQLSRDQEPVLFHDRGLERVCGFQGQAHQTSFRQLMTLRASEFDRFGYKFAQTPIASLNGFCDLLQRHPEVTAFVEIKRAGLENFGIATVLNRVLPEITPLARQCVVISYSTHALHAVREQENLRLGVILEKWSQRKLGSVRSLQPEFIFCDIDHLPRWGRLRTDGAKLAVFEVTDPRLALALARRGVDLIETFDIGGMQEQLALLGGDPS